MSITTSRRAPVRAAGGTTDVLLAACLWGTTGTVRTSVAAASSVSIAAVRIVVGGVILLALAVASRRGGRPTGGPGRLADRPGRLADRPVVARGTGLRRLLAGRRNRLPLGVGAVAIAVYQTAFFAAAARTGVAVGTVVTIGSAPAFAGLLSVVLRRSPLSPRWLVATAGAVAGCTALALAGGGGGDAGPEPVGIALALTSGLAYAVYATVLSALVARGEEGRAVTGALFGGAALVMVPSLLSGSAGWVLTGRGALVALYLGVLTTAGGYLLFARGLRTVPATTATTLTLAEPAVAAVLGVAVLDEALGATALAGIALVAASLVLLVTRRE